VWLTFLEKENLFENVFEVHGMMKLELPIFRSQVLARFMTAVIPTTPPRSDNPVGATLKLDIVAARDGECATTTGTAIPALNSTAAT
jgi:hypothetical protein